MAKYGGLLTQSFRQMPNPEPALEYRRSGSSCQLLRRTLGWTTPQCESTHISRDVLGLMRRDLSLAFWREKGMLDWLEIGDVK